MHRPVPQGQPARRRRSRRPRCGGRRVRRLRHRLGVARLAQRGGRQHRRRRGRQGELQGAPQGVPHPARRLRRHDGQALPAQRVPPGQPRRHRVRRVERPGELPVPRLREHPGIRPARCLEQDPHGPPGQPVRRPDRHAPSEQAVQRRQGRQGVPRQRRAGQAAHGGPRDVRAWLEGRDVVGALGRRDRRGARHVGGRQRGLRQVEEPRHGVLRPGVRGLLAVRRQPVVELRRPEVRRCEGRLHRHQEARRGHVVGPHGQPGRLAAQGARDEVPCSPGRTGHGRLDRW
ncbi:hypothetical protein D3C74_331900 [compost metagenome]